MTGTGVPVPFVFGKTHGKSTLANAVKTGMEVADDVLEGRPVKESAKRRVPAGIKRTVQSMSAQSGSGVRGRRLRRRAKQRERSKVIAKKTNRRRDRFS